MQVKGTQGLKFSCRGSEIRGAECWSHFSHKNPSSLSSFLFSSPQLHAEILCTTSFPLTLDTVFSALNSL